MAEAPERIWVPRYENGRLSLVWWKVRSHGMPSDETYIHARRYDRALGAAKEAAGELEALHKAKIIPRGSGEILEMVKAEIEELEGE